MNFTEHGEREMRLAGMMRDLEHSKIPHTVLALLEVMDKAHKSYDFTERDIKSLTLLFARLSMHETLTPLTQNEEEWENISDAMGYPMWQNTRNPRFFSEDGGKTSYDIFQKDRGCKCKKKESR